MVDMISLSSVPVDTIIVVTETLAPFREHLNGTRIQLWIPTVISPLRRDRGMRGLMRRNDMPQCLYQQLSLLIYVSSTIGISFRTYSSPRESRALLSSTDSKITTSAIEALCAKSRNSVLSLEAKLQRDMMENSIWHQRSGVSALYHFGILKRSYKFAFRLFHLKQWPCPSPILNGLQRMHVPQKLLQRRTFFRMGLARPLGKLGPASQ